MIKIQLVLTVLLKLFNEDYLLILNFFFRNFFFYFFFSSATEKLLEYAKIYQQKSSPENKRASEESWRLLPIEQRLEHALVKGLDQFIVGDTELARLDSARLGLDQGLE